jgi:tRNA-dihydrouridine synthase A
MNYQSNLDIVNQIDPELVSRLSVAPMMDWTDRHCRFFYRLMSSKVQLFTEMITSKAILNGDKNRLLNFNDIEHPLVLQLGGSEHLEMAKCTKIAKEWGYDEVNINVGCPSDRVQSGSFGACLMQTPSVVADCVYSMMQISDIKVSVKTRIGVDDMESYDELCEFIKTVKSGGCDKFIIHARKAWLKGLSPKQNRTIPPLKYDWVYRLKKEFSELDITINGGINTLEEAQNHLYKVDGVMLGRAVYLQPYLLSDVDDKIYQQYSPKNTREQVLLKYIEYIEKQNKIGVPVRSMTRHILGLYHGQKNAKKFRQLLSGKSVEIKHIDEWLKFLEKEEIYG